MSVKKNLTNDELKNAIAFTIDYKNKRVGINKPEPEFEMDVSGDINASNNIQGSKIIGLSNNNTFGSTTVTGVLNVDGITQYTPYAFPPDGVSLGSEYFNANTKKKYYYDGNNWIPVVGDLNDFQLILDIEPIADNIEFRKVAGYNTIITANGAVPSNGDPTSHHYVPFITTNNFGTALIAKLSAETITTRGVGDDNNVSHLSIGDVTFNGYAIGQHTIQVLNTDNSVHNFMYYPNDQDISFDLETVEANPVILKGLSEWGIGESEVQITVDNLVTNDAGGAYIPAENTIDGVRWNLSGWEIEWVGLDETIEFLVEGDSFQFGNSTLGASVGATAADNDVGKLTLYINNITGDGRRVAKVTGKFSQEQGAVTHELILSQLGLDQGVEPLNNTLGTSTLNENSQIGLYVKDESDYRERFMYWLVNGVQYNGSGSAFLLMLTMDSDKTVVARFGPPSPDGDEQLGGGPQF